MQLHAISTRLAGAVFLLLAAGAPAAAADSAPVPANEATVSNGSGNEATTPAHAAKPAADEPKKICRSIASTTSRLKTTRICLTREQWRAATYK
jgi:hypothetical protein